jgi:hypothetical protein
MESLLNQHPPELHTLPVFAAGWVAIVGLLLWSAGVKAARPLAAITLGAALAAVAAWLLPAFTGLGELAAGAFGLVAGVIIGALAFRALQGILLATCLGVAAASGFYFWQIAHQPPNAPAAIVTPPASDVHFALPLTPATAAAAFADYARHTLQVVAAHWNAIPSTLRQSMIAIALAVAVLALAVAWILPRYTTWLTSATGGAALLLLGALALLRLYGPQYERLIPTSPQTRLAAVTVFVLVGMLVQRACFWPGKVQKAVAQPNP